MSNLQVMTSRAILNHPLNESGTSWKFLVVAQDSLTALEGYFHHQGSSGVETTARLHTMILEDIATDVWSCEHLDGSYVEDVSPADCVAVAIETYRARPKMVARVAERLQERWVWAQELTEVEMGELLDMIV